MDIPQPDPAAITGLSSTEAATRLTADGPNALQRAKRRSLLRVILNVLREPMLALLLGGGVVYLLLGSRAEALILLAFACMSVGITVVQEARTERVLEALRDLTSPRALVIRGGERLRIAGSEVVRGDVIVLAEGDRVPADARLLQASDLSADESLLTGEAVPVRKAVAPQAPRATGRRGSTAGLFRQPDRARHGPGKRDRHRSASEIGRIGTSLNQLETDTPHLQRQMRKLVLVFALVGGAVSAGRRGALRLLRGGWLDGVLAGIAVGMSMLPEEFPMVLAVFMAMGAWRISKARVLTRRASAIETLGAATRALHRQDRHADRKPHDDCRTAPADGTAARSALPCARGLPRTGGGGRDGLGARTASIRWKRRFTHWQQTDLREGETLPGAGRHA